MSRLAKTRVSDDSPPRKRRARLLWVVPGVIVLLLVGLVVADAITRSRVEARIAHSVTQSLPTDAHANPDVTLGGFSVLQQLLRGRLDEIKLTASHVTYRGIPFTVSVKATDVPTDESRPIPVATARITMSDTALNSLLSAAGFNGTVTLEHAGIGYRGTVTILGVPLTYTATATPQAEGTRILLHPDAGSLSSSLGSLSLEPLVRALTQQGTIAVCAASYLPKGVTVSDIHVTNGHITLTLRASHVLLDDEWWSTHGSCS